jgi:hypothetical protein
MTFEIDRYMPCQQTLGAMLINQPGIDFYRTETQSKRQVLSSAYFAISSTYESILTVHLIVVTMSPELGNIGSHMVYVQ